MNATMRMTMDTVLKPLIEQRADPYIYKHTDGYYYFTASVPQYDRIELRRAPTIAGAGHAPTVDAWIKPDAVRTAN
jgi:GH43 family beta-xylosidase